MAATHQQAADNYLARLLEWQQQRNGSKADMGRPAAAAAADATPLVAAAAAAAEESVQPPSAHSSSHRDFGSSGGRQMAQVR